MTVMQQKVSSPNQMISHMMTPEQFWQVTNATQLTEKYRVDKNLTYLKTASLAYLKKIFVQYRYFTIYYIQDLAVLISKLPFDRLKSVLAEILYEELGNGQHTHAHPVLYDNFLRSIGITQEELLFQDYRCIQILEDIQNKVKEEAWVNGVGLRGMGGECLCQIYLSAMYDAFSQNPIMIELQNKMDGTFWEIHTGEVDLHHQLLMRNVLDELITNESALIPALLSSYQISQIAWDEFWSNIYSSAQRSAS